MKSEQIAAIKQSLRTYAWPREHWLPNMKDPAAVLFRREVGWLNEEDHFEGTYTDEHNAHDFCSIQGNASQIWTIMTIHWYGEAATKEARLGTLTEYQGGQVINRQNLGG